MSRFNRLLLWMLLYLIAVILLPGGKSVPAQTESAIAACVLALVAEFGINRVINKIINAYVRRRTNGAQNH